MVDDGRRRVGAVCATGERVTAVLTRSLFGRPGRTFAMEIGFDFGANVPTGVFALHAAAAVVFIYLASVNAAAGESIGILLNAFIGIMLVTAGVVTARITDRRD